MISLSDNTFDIALLFIATIFFSFELAFASDTGRIIKVFFLYFLCTIESMCVASHLKAFRDATKACYSNITFPTIVCNIIMREKKVSQTYVRNVKAAKKKKVNALIYDIRINKM